MARGRKEIDIRSFCDIMAITPSNGGQSCGLQEAYSWAGGKQREPLSWEMARWEAGDKPPWATIDDSWTIVDSWKNLKKKNFQKKKFQNFFLKYRR